jgi:hypothetical protein
MRLNPDATPSPARSSTSGARPWPPSPDPQTARHTRRVRRLLQTWAPDDLTGLLADPRGRYVAVLRGDRDELWFQAEWPHELPDG